MVDRARGIRKSNFPAQTTIPSGATFDFVINGTNIKILAADLLAALGVTGTIVQAGDPLSTPVLDPQGTVNRIRNLEDGSGIKTSLSAENGITVKHNFSEDTTGVEILDEITAVSPKFASLLPGLGIAISKTDDVITFSATGQLPITLVKIVNEESDFPAAISGIITLLSGVVYLISNNVSTTNRFVLGDNTSIVGLSQRGPTLTYTGTQTMFTGIDIDATFLNVSLDCPVGKLFAFTDSGGGSNNVSFTSVMVLSCDSIGSFLSMGSVVMVLFFVGNITSQGITFDGADSNVINLVSIALVSSNATFIGVDLQAAVAQSIDIINSVFEGVSGAIAIKGAPSNANLTATGLGRIDSASFIGDITTHSGLDLQQDVQWVAENNQDIEDTRPGSLSYNTAGVIISIAAPSTPVVIAGTWIDGGSAHFVPDLSGRVTYIGLKTLQTSITAVVTTAPSSGGSKEFSVTITINGVPVDASNAIGLASSGDKNQVTIIWEHAFEPDDFVELFLANNTDSQDFDVMHALLRLT